MKTTLEELGIKPWDFGLYVLTRDIKSALSEGKLVKPMSANTIFDIIRTEDWFRKSRIPTHQDIQETAEKIAIAQFERTEK